MEKIKSLIQGVLFDKNKKKYIENYRTLIEGIDGTNSNTEPDIATLRNQYNRKIEEWIQKYRQYVTQQLNQDIDISMFKDKVIKYDNTYY